MALRTRNLIVLLSLFMGCFICQSTSYSQNQIIELTDDEKEWISLNPIIKSVNDMSYPPFDFVIDGKPAGFSIDYLNLIASKVGLKVDYVNDRPWVEQMDMLKSGEIDLAHSIAYTDERTSYLNFSRPYMDLPAAIFGRKGEAYIKNIDDLKNKRIAVIKGWANQVYYRENYPEFEFVEFNTIKDALVGISRKEVDIFFNTISISNYIISKNFIPGLEVIGREEFLASKGLDQLHFATRKDIPLLASIIKKGMEAVSAEEFNALSEKWQAEYVFERGLGLTAEEIKWLSQNNTFIVAADPTVAPIEFIGEDGRILGIAGKYLDLISEKLGIDFQWAGNKNWAEAMEKIHAKEADILSGVINIEDRRKFLTFTDVYLPLTNVIFARENGEVFGSMAGLSGKTIAMVEGSAVTEFIREQYPEVNILEVPSVIDCMNLLVTGKVDAHIGDIPITAHIMATEGISQIVAVGETPYKTNFSMGIRSELPLLASAMQKAMKSITPAQRAAISREWLSLKMAQNESYEVYWRAFGIIVGIFSIFLILVWNNNLRREVKRRKKVEEKLRESEKRAQLALLEAETANEAKSAFLANMSHEIRTPLNAIMGFSEVMTSGIFGEIHPPQYKEYAEDIRSSGEHLTTVIKDILDLSKIEAGKWQLHEEEFKLETCIKDALKMIENPAKEKKIELVYENFVKKKTADETGSFIKLNADDSAIKRVIINLLSNSVKFTEDGGKISCRIFKAEDGRVFIKIKDNGIGIPKDRIEHVLHPFEQVNGAYYLNDEGTGLGLSIVQKLVELHGGEFLLESEECIGTSATISLPPERVVA